MYTDINHQEQFAKRCKAARDLQKAGLNLTKTGHLFIIRGKLGSVYQSHSIIDIENWIKQKQRTGNLLTSDISCPECDDRTVAMKYHKTIRL